MQLSTPEAESLPAQASTTGRSYQPLESGERVGLAITSGAVASYWSGSVAAAVFPALSVHPPLGAALPVSGPL